MAVCVNAQDTVQLNSVEVRAQKANLAQIGKKFETIDSTLKEQFSSRRFEF